VVSQRRCTLGGYSILRVWHGQVVLLAGLGWSGALGFECIWCIRGVGWVSGYWRVQGGMVVMSC